jgi:hypothetical protein
MWLNRVEKKPSLLMTVLKKNKLVYESNLKLLLKLHFEIRKNFLIIKIFQQLFKKIVNIYN